jgi:hypothetical protein
LKQRNFPTLFLIKQKVKSALNTSNDSGLVRISR